MNVETKRFELSGGVIVEDSEGKFSGAMKRAMKNDRYELMERRAIEASIREGDKVIELGAGCGVIGACIAQKTAPANITSVEANPLLLPVIAHTHDINKAGGITVINAIVGPEDGSADFHIAEDFWASSLSPDIPNIMQTVRIDTVNVNTLIAESGANVLVADIEGAEFDLFPQIDWTPIDLVIVELHPDMTSFANLGRLFTTLIGAGLIPDIANTQRARVMTFKKVSRD